MCSPACINFGKQNLSESEIKGKSVIEVGSYNVNGSLRTYITSLKPQSYLGVDISEGPGVDKICKAEDLVTTFGENSFDIVISTEMLEHVEDWRIVIHNLKMLLKESGILLITTRSKGFAYHGYPHDYWRYELEDMKQIFRDCDILFLASDPSPRAPGVFIKVTKPSNFKECDLTNIQLHKMEKRS